MLAFSKAVIVGRGKNSSRLHLMGANQEEQLDERSRWLSQLLGFPQTPPVCVSRPGSPKQLGEDPGQGQNREWCSVSRLRGSGLFAVGLWQLGMTRQEGWKWYLEELNTPGDPRCSAWLPNRGSGWQIYEIYAGVRNLSAFLCFSIKVYDWIGVSLFHFPFKLTALTSKSIFFFCQEASFGEPTEPSDSQWISHWFPLKKELWVWYVCLFCHICLRTLNMYIIIYSKNNVKNDYFWSSFILLHANVYVFLCREVNVCGSGVLLGGGVSGLWTGSNNVKTSKLRNSQFWTHLPQECQIRDNESCTSRQNIYLGQSWELRIESINSYSHSGDFIYLVSFDK